MTRNFEEVEKFVAGVVIHGYVTDHGTLLLGGAEDTERVEVTEFPDCIRVGNKVLERWSVSISESGYALAEYG